MLLLLANCLSSSATLQHKQMELYNSIQGYYKRSLFERQSAPFTFRTNIGTVYKLLPLLASLFKEFPKEK